MFSLSSKFSASKLAKRFLIALLIVPALAMAGKIELPDWEEGDKPEEFQLGVGLWPAGVLDVAAAKSKPKDDKEKDPDSAESIAAVGNSEKGTEEKPSTGVVTGEAPDDPAKVDDVNSIAGLPPEPVAKLRDVVEIPPTNQVETPSEIEISDVVLPTLLEIAEVMPPITGELRDRYFKNRPRDFLIDPQQMLTEQKSNDVRRFLEYHAEEAGIDIYLIVMGNGQKVPEDVSLVTQHREWFGEMPTALVATTMGNMGNTEIIYGDEITQSVQKSALDKVYQHCLREAQKIENDSDQVEQLALELSIQLYWVSQLLEKDGTISSHDVSAALPVEKPATARPVDSEMGQPIPFQASSSNFLMAKGPYDVPVIWLLIGGVISVAAVIALWMASWMWRRDSLDRKPVIFDELQMPSRLGGEFSGGGFVGMSYEVGSGE